MGMYTIALALVAFTVYCNALPTLTQTKTLYSQFKNKYGRTFQSEVEDQLRFDIFSKRLQSIEELNKLHEADNVKFGVTKFADWTREERANFLTSKPMAHRNPFQVKDTANLGAAQPEWDWRNQGGVTSVKDQGQCGSCWAFAATAVVESANKIKDGVELDLSEQFLVNCDKQSAGCDGGWYDYALDVVIAKGLLKESELPYKAVNGKCPSKTGVTKISKYVYVSTKADEMAAWVQANGPVAVYFGVPDSFFDYVSGIYSPSVTQCSEDNVVGYHAVQVVGYGLEGTKQFWIVKNSWAADWGENGFFKITRGADTCEIEEMPVGAFV